MPKSRKKSTEKSSRKTKNRDHTKLEDLKVATTRKHLSAIGTFDRATLTKELKIDAKALSIPPAAADLFIKRTLDAVEKELRPKKIITERDLYSTIARELKKFNPDFAYIYQNRDKII